MGSRAQLRRVAVAAIALAMACAHPAVRTEAPPERETPAPQHERRVQTGGASYYGNEFEARLTASGVPYRSSQMTCSHRTLPFRTVLRVTDVETKNSVVVKVTDRGPFAKGRVVDLSLTAARKLGIVDRGLTRVTMDIGAVTGRGQKDLFHPAPVRGSAAMTGGGKRKSRNESAPP